MGDPAADPNPNQETPKADPWVDPAADPVYKEKKYKKGRIEEGKKDPPNSLCQLLTFLIREVNPRARVQDVAPPAGIDRQLAEKVATWAFHDSPDWSNGSHWRHALKSQRVFWEQWTELERQYRRATSTGTTAPMRAKAEKAAELAKRIPRTKLAPRIKPEVPF